jgi:hypothetical protein
MDSFAARVGGLQAEHVPFEFTHAANVLLDHHLQERFDLLLLLVNALSQLLVQLHHCAKRPPNVRIGDGRNVYRGLIIRHVELPCEKEM